MSDTFPTVSIIIPTYNRSALLVRAIESALRQTYPHVEIVIVDDASTDETPQVVQPFLRHPGVRYHRNEKNLGLVGNWRKGFELAQGAFCSFLCDDDLLDPRFVEKLLKPLLEDHSLGFSFSDLWVIDMEDNLLIPDTERLFLSSSRHLLQEGRVPHLLHAVLIHRPMFIGATLFRRSSMHSSWFREEAKGHVDYWLYYQYAHHGWEAYYIPERLIYVREEWGSVSRNSRWKKYMLEGQLFYLRHLLSDPACAPYQAILLEALARGMTTYGNTLLIEGQTRKARRVLQQALQMRKTLKNVTGYVVSFLGPSAPSLANHLQQLSQKLNRL